ncbi:MAG: hypothetical protein AB1632_14935 [Nitrospirota bacterium]
MKKTLAVILAASLVLSSAGNAFAGWVRDHYRSNGTYVQPHYRSNPDGYKWNNYGPSRNSYERTNPYGRDNDRDGMPNHLDRDDNNNGIYDDYDSNQYRR